MKLCTNFIKMEFLELFDTMPYTVKTYVNLIVLVAVFLWVQDDVFSI